MTKPNWALWDLVRGEAKRFGVSVQEIVLRKDWRDEETGEEGTETVLDVYVDPGDVNDRFEFWNAVGKKIDLSVSIHVR